MVDLGSDAARLAHALWVEDYETVAGAARAIAEHPTVPEGERLAIAKTLNGDFATFVSEDRAVHDLALEIEAAATSKQPRVIVERYGALAAACVRCHVSYRHRLRPRLIELREGG